MWVRGALVLVAGARGGVGVGVVARAKLTGADGAGEARRGRRRPRLRILVAVAGRRGGGAAERVEGRLAACEELRDDALADRLQEEGCGVHCGVWE